VAVAAPPAVPQEAVLPVAPEGLPLSEVPEATRRFVVQEGIPRLVVVLTTVERTMEVVITAPITAAPGSSRVRR